MRFTHVSYSRRQAVRLIGGFAAGLVGLGTRPGIDLAGALGTGPTEEYEVFGDFILFPYGQNAPAAAAAVAAPARAPRPQAPETTPTTLRYDDLATASQISGVTLYSLPKTVVLGAKDGFCEIRWTNTKTPGVVDIVPIYVGDDGMVDPVATISATVGVPTPYPIATTPQRPAPPSISTWPQVQLTTSLLPTPGIIVGTQESGFVARWIEDHVLYVLEVRPSPNAPNQSDILASLQPIDG